MQTTTKSTVPSTSLPAQSAPQAKPGQAPSLPQPLPAELLQQVSGGGRAPGTGW